MSVDKLNAKKDEFVGTAKKVAGKVTGDKHLENEGKVEELAGKAGSILADAKDTVKGALDGMKNSNK